METKWSFDGMGIVLENRERVVCREVGTLEDAKLIVNAPKMFNVFKHFLYYDADDNGLDALFAAGFGEHLGKVFANEIRSAVSNIEIS